MTEAVESSDTNPTQIDNRVLIEQAKKRQKSIDRMDKLNDWAFLAQVFITLGYVTFNNGESIAVAWGATTVGVSVANYYACYRAGERARHKNDKLIVELEKQQQAV